MRPLYLLVHISYIQRELQNLMLGRTVNMGYETLSLGTTTMLLQDSVMHFFLGNNLLTTALIVSG